MKPVVVLMGVCGSGKTEVGRRLAARLGCDFLDGSRKMLATRLAARQGHFMPPGLLESQLATLERPGADERAITIDVAASPDEIAERIVGAISPT